MGKNIRKVVACIATIVMCLGVSLGSVSAASAETTTPSRASVIRQVVDVPSSSNTRVSAKGVTARIVWGDYRNLRSFAAYSGRNCRGHMYSVAAKQLSHPGIDSVFQAPYVEMSAYGGLKTWKATSKGACHNLTVPFQVNRIRVKGGVSSWAIKPNRGKS